MKVIYSPNTEMHWQDFGILIPLSQSRSQQVWEGLCLSYPDQLWWDQEKGRKISWEDLARVHTKEYCQKLQGVGLENAIQMAYELVDQNGKFHRYDPTQARLPLTSMLERCWNHAEGTLRACDLALSEGEAFFLGGGMHHAMSFGGRGFCLFNDIVIALRKLQTENKIKTAWIIDVDAHKGDGTAEIVADDLSLKTLSIHMVDSWPLNPLERIECSVASDIDIEHRKGEEEFYLEKLANGLKQLSKMTKPDLVLVVDGADIAHDDQLPSTQTLRLSRKQCLERDMMVYDFLKKQNLPMAFVMAGGYGPSSYEIYLQFLLKLMGQESSSFSKIFTR